MKDDNIPEADRVEGAPHPRETQILFGQASAENEFLTAFNAGHLHHAWLITGPQGIGKATLAWRMARFLLTQPVNADAGGGLFGEDLTPATPENLDVDEFHPVAARIAALSEPRLKLLRRAWDHKKDKHKTVITIDEVRELKNFLMMSAADGGRRVVIVDSADEMNTSASNALLKLLEEPPADVTLLLISHQPSALLPTIRSRCQTLRLHPLNPADMAQALTETGTEIPASTEALATLAGGSAGTALRLLNLGGMEAYHNIVALFGTCPGIDRPGLLRLAESAAGVKNVDHFDLLLRLLDFFIARLARAGVAGPPAHEACNGEAETLTRLSPNPHAGRAWAQAQQELGARARHGKAVNLDPAALLLDMGLKIDALAAKHATR
ncbi:MAG: DNA polymerase III subunit delta' [Halocynthiibacter sp.]